MKTEVQGIIPAFKSIDTFMISGGRRMYTIINDRDRKAGSGGRCEFQDMEILLDGVLGKIIAAEYHPVSEPMHWAGRPVCIYFKPY